MRNNENRAKNIIIFIGDGMGMASITTGRIFTGQAMGQTGEEYKLAFETFPNSAFSKVIIKGEYKTKNIVAKLEMKSTQHGICIYPRKFDEKEWKKKKKNNF